MGKSSVKLKLPLPLFTVGLVIPVGPLSSYISSKSSTSGPRTISRTFEWLFPVGGTNNRLRCKMRPNWRRRRHKKNKESKSTSDPNTAASVIAATAPRSPCDEDAEMGVGLVDAISVNDGKQRTGKVG